MKEQLPSVAIGRALKEGIKYLSTFTQVGLQRARWQLDEERAQTDETYKVLSVALQQKHHQENLLTRQYEAEQNRLLQSELFQKQRTLQLEIKAMEIELARERRKADRQAQLENLRRQRELQQLPIYSGSEAILSRPLEEGLSRVHIFYAPPTLQHDKVRLEEGFPQREQALTDKLRDFVEQYVQVGRPTRIEGGAWISKIHHGEAATGAIFRELRTEPIILVEASVEGSHYFLKMGHWWENASDYQFKKVWQVSWVDLLNEIVKGRILELQKLQQMQGWSVQDLATKISRTAFTEYQTALAQMESERLLGGLAEPMRYKPNEHDLQKLIDWLSAIQNIFVGILLDDYFLFHSAPAFRQKPLLPQLLAKNLTELPAAVKEDIVAQLTIHYQQLYEMLITTQTNWATDFQLDLADIFVTLGKMDLAHQIWKTVWKTIWHMGRPNSNEIPEVALQQLEIQPKDLDWVEMLCVATERMNLLEYQQLLPHLRALRSDTISQEILKRPDTKQSKPFIMTEKHLKAIESAQKNPPVFLLIGRTGVGKSSTINSLLGKQVAPVGEYEPTTMEVKHYEAEMDHGVKFKVFDTPGLCDDLEEKNNDHVYLELIRKSVPSVSCTWFITRLDDTRVSSDEKRGIRLISDCFSKSGKSVWQNAIIIFTFSDNKSADKYPEAFVKRTELIRKEIALATKDEKMAANIPSIAISNKSEMNPDGTKWLPELYIQVVKMMASENFQAFFLGMLNSITPPQAKIDGLQAEVAYLKTTNTRNTIEKEEQADRIRSLQRQIKVIETTPKDDPRIDLSNPVHQEIIKEKLKEHAPEIVASAKSYAEVGAWTGGFIGTIITPGPGTVIGAAIGATTGAIIGAAVETVNVVKKIFNWKW